MMFMEKKLLPELSTRIISQDDHNITFLGCYFFPITLNY